MLRPARRMHALLPMSRDPLSILMASGPMPADEAVRIGRDVAGAIGGVHGELWPSAILVGEGGADVLPSGGIDRSRYGQYAAPERILGKPPTAASDVFSLGAILFHAVAGFPPFRGTSPAAVMLAALCEAPLPVPEHVPQGLAEVLRRALARDPAHRYGSPAVLRDALDACARTLWQDRRILAVDDDAPIRELYHQIITRMGVGADVVASGRDAIEAFKTRRYDVALLDLNLPRLSGWEVLDFLRAHPPARPCRLFIVTGFTGQDVSDAERDIVTAVLYKPVVPEELRALIAECLRGGTPDVPRILRSTGHRVVAG